MDTMKKNNKTFCAITLMLNLLNQQIESESLFETYEDCVGKVKGWKFHIYCEGDSFKNPEFSFYAVCNSRAFRCEMTRDFNEFFKCLKCTVDAIKSGLVVE